MDICEIFTSIQGEGPNIGKPTLFIRLSGCNLNCPYCDTKYCFTESKRIEKKKIIDIIKNSDKMICFTGGEPLLQKNEVYEIVTFFSKKEFEIQTNGTIAINNKLKNVIWAIDIKTPSSKGFFNKDNLKLLSENDWVNFVIADDSDLDWVYLFLSENKLNTDKIYLTPAYRAMNYSDLAEKIVDCKIKNVRLGIQIHKLIWGEERKR
jgi:7-carboxy-7-deazaguanine synthase